MSEFARQTAVDFLRRTVPDLQAVYLFGSLATRDDREESDVDLAALAARPLANNRLWEWRATLAGLLGREVDLVDLRRADTVLAAQVVAAGERLWTAGGGAADWFETITLSQYVQLNDERQGIIEDIVKRGSIYA